MNALVRGCAGCGRDCAPWPRSVALGVLSTGNGRLCKPCYQRRRYTPVDRTVDEIAVERTIGGDRPTRLTAAERHQVVHTMTRQGYSIMQIAERLRVTPRTVQRHRAAA